MKSYLLVLMSCLVVFVTAAAADDKTPSLYKQLKIEDDVIWIDETPQKPEDYVGQVWLIQANGDSLPYHTPIVVPVQTYDEPTVKKSVLVKAKADGSVSFLSILSVKGDSESVYQFQIVDSKKWAVNARDSKYAKALSAFRNDPMSASIFDDNQFSGVVMCSAVVQKKLWYKNFKKKSWGASGTYYVKVEGNDYFGTEDYEETVKYGLLMRPIHGFGYKLPKTIVNAKQVERLSEKMKIPSDVFTKFKVDKLDKEIDSKNPYFDKKVPSKTEPHGGKL